MLDREKSKEKRLRIISKVTFIIVIVVATIGMVVLVVVVVILFHVDSFLPPMLPYGTLTHFLYLLHIALLYNKN